MTTRPTTRLAVVLLGGLLLGALQPVAAAASDVVLPSPRFIREYWYEPGLEHGNPRFDERFRVNAPEVVLDPRFMHRREVRENGLMMILIEEDLARLKAAELYLELWGGHPGSGEKRVTVNGRSTYVIPDVGTAHSCTHSYPTLSLKITDLVNGYNALQFAVDQGETFWGHFIVDGAALRLELRPDHPDLSAAGLAGFEAHLSATPGVSEAGLVGFQAGPGAAPGVGETLELRLESPDTSKVERVDFRGGYEGYAENGSPYSDGWHGFTKNRKPQAHLGTTTEAPFALTWDTSMLPAQEYVSAIALVRFRGHPELLYQTVPLAHPPPPRYPTVSIHHCTDLPKPFWSRAGKRQACDVELDFDLVDIERAELHVVLWDGGAGTVEEYFTLNSRPIDVAGGGHHDVLYRVVPLEPGLLRRGPNRIELLSDTEHHGIEILLPGPAIVVRSRYAEEGGTP